MPKTWYMTASLQSYRSGYDVMPNYIVYNAKCFGIYQQIQP